MLLPSAGGVADGGGGLSQEPQEPQPLPQPGATLKKVDIFASSRPQRTRPRTMARRTPAGRYLVEKCSSAAATIRATMRVCHLVCS